MATFMTVDGPLPAEQAGMVLPHEHLFLNLMPEYRGIGLLNNIDLAVDEVALFQTAGGGTIFDVTPAGLANGSNGRGDESPRSIETQREEGARPSANIRALQEVARRTGVNIVAGTGHYREPYLDRDWFDRTTVDEIADFLVRDIEEGFPNTDARAGIIGEIGADKWYISAAEERSFRAAARAHRRTGLPITTHAARWASVGFAQLDLLESEGVPPEKIVMGHVDTVADPGYAAAMAARGVTIQFDTFYEDRRGGVVNDLSLGPRINALVELVRAGFGKRILISHDVCLSTHLVRNGGTGYAFIADEVPGRLEAAGLEAEEIRDLMQANAQRVLAL